MTIAQLNELFSGKMLHPQFALLRFADARSLPVRFSLGCAAVWLRSGYDPCRVTFGWKECDFTDGTLVFLREGAVLCADCLKACGGAGRLLCFPASLCDNYSFFNYRKEESLHLSARERQVVEDLFASIDNELRWGVDEDSHAILADCVRLLCDYVSRFYRRQFITRHDEGEWVVAAATEVIEKCFMARHAWRGASPSVEVISRQFHLSPAYFNDLLCHETGKDFDDFVKFKRIDMAAELLDRGRGIDEVAALLGFSSTHDFCVAFKKLGIYVPGEPVLQ